MSGSLGQELDEPIPLPKGKPLATLRDAALPVSVANQSA
jgi:hypothetical protein